MTGRKEMENMMFDSIEKRLEEYPNYVHSWYLHLRANGKTASSCDVMVGKIGAFLKFIRDDKKNIKPEEITIEAVEKYLIKIKTRKKDNEIIETSFSYQKTVLNCLKNFLQFMYKRNLIPENYITAQEIKPPKKQDTIDRIRLDGNDFKKIISTVSKGKELDYIRNRDVAILSIFMNTGIRLSALCSINVEDINLEDGYLTVIDKGEKTRKCKLNEFTINMIKDWLKVRQYMIELPWERALFVSNRGIRIKDEGTRKAIKNRCAEAGYELSPHKLRGGYIMILQEATGDINFVCDAVGHSSITTTKRYIGKNEANIEKAADIMAKAIKF